MIIECYHCLFSLPFHFGSLITNSRYSKKAELDHSANTHVLCASRDGSNTVKITLLFQRKQYNTIDPHTTTVAIAVHGPFGKARLASHPCD